MNTRVQKQKGFSAIIAVVLIVLFALLGTFMATLFNTGSLTTSQSRGTMQAWAAAMAGIQWAVFRVINDGDCAAVNAINFNLTGGAANGFNVAFTCIVFDEDGAGDGITDDEDSPYNVYDITLTASKGNPGEITYLSRSINLSVNDGD